MKKYLSYATLSILTLTTLGCAHHNVALEDARRSYKNAASDPSVKENAPVALHEADLALQKANEAEKNGPKEDVTHLADIANKRVEIARNEAQKKVSETQFQDVSKNRTNALISARETEANDARAKSQALESENQKLETSSAEAMNQKTAAEAQSATLTAKNEELSKQLADLKMKPTARGMELTLRDTMFESGKSELTSGARRDLEKISQELKNAADKKILVEGHTDSVGTDAFNDSLSQRRADAVREILVHNLDTNMVTARGMGKQYPIAPNTTAAGRQQNRRVTITILSSNEETNGMTQSK